MFKFNIGSAVNGINRSLDAGRVYDALQSAGFFDVRLIGIKPSDTEDTYIFTAEGFTSQDARFSDNWTHKRAVFNLCQVFSQDCIAYMVNHTGYLVGPKADEWGGEFNPAYFLD